MGIKSVFRAALAVWAAAGVATTASAATAQGQGKAVIVTTLSFISAEELEFGSIVAGTTAGTVVVSPTGARTKTGGVTLISGGTVQAARFAGRGGFNQLVAISVATVPITLRRISGTETMTVDTFVIGSTPSAVLGTTPLNFRIATTTGVFNFPVGGTLRVGANQRPGDYVGTLTITLNYL